MELQFEGLSEEIRTAGFSSGTSFRFVPNFTISLSGSTGKNNSAGILSFVWEEHPTNQARNSGSYYLQPISKDRGWVIIVSLIPKKPAGIPSRQKNPQFIKILRFYDSLANCITDQLGS